MISTAVRPPVAGHQEAKNSFLARRMTIGPDDVDAWAVAIVRVEALEPPARRRWDGDAHHRDATGLVGARLHRNYCSRGDRAHAPATQRLLRHRQRVADRRPAIALLVPRRRVSRDALAQGCRVAPLPTSLQPLALSLQSLRLSHRASSWARDRSTAASGCQDGGPRALISGTAWRTTPREAVSPSAGCPSGAARPSAAPLVERSQAPVPPSSHSPSSTRGPARASVFEPHQSRR